MTTTPAAPSVPLPTPPVDPDSLVARLRARRERQAKQRQRVFEIPGYGGELGVRMRAVDEAGAIADMSVMLGDDDASEADAAALFNARRETIVRACVEVVTRDEESRAWIPVAKVIGSPLPVRFDEQLVEWLGGTPGEVTIEKGGAVAALRWVLSQPLQFMDLYSVYVEWCALEEPLDDDELVGESSAAS